jgi:uncharacterized protein YqfB (UPF0267 family)
MFKKGDLIRMIDDEDNELFVIIKINAPKIMSYNALGRAKYGKDRTRMVVKPVDNPTYPGEIIVEKSLCEHFMTKKEVKPYSFLD